MFASATCSGFANACLELRRLRRAADEHQLVRRVARRTRAVAAPCRRSGPDCARAGGSSRPRRRRPRRSTATRARQRAASATTCASAGPRGAGRGPMSAAGTRWLLAGSPMVGVGAVGDDAPVEHLDLAGQPCGELVVVGDHDDRRAGGVQLLEEREDRGAVGWSRGCRSARRRARSRAARRARARSRRADAHRRRASSAGSSRGVRARPASSARAASARRSRAATPA